MKTYIVSLLAVALISGIVSMLSPNGGSGIKKSVSLLSALCVLCILVRPIGKIASELKNAGSIFERGIVSSNYSEENYAEIYNNNLIKYSEADVSEALGNMLCTEFELPAETIDVSAVMSDNGNEYIVDRVIICLRGKAVFSDPHKICEYVNSLLKCECEIIYD